MITNRILPALALLLLGGIALIGVILLAALGHQVPDVLPTLATVSLSALAGVAVPALAITSSPSSSPPPSSPATPAAADVTAAAGGSGIHIVAGVPTAA